MPAHPPPTHRPRFWVCPRPFGGLSCTAGARHLLPAGLATIPRRDSAMCAPLGLVCAGPGSRSPRVRLRVLWVFAVRAVANRLAAAYRGSNKTGVLYNNKFFKFVITRFFLTARRLCLDSRLKKTYKTYVLYDPEGLCSCSFAPLLPPAPVARGGLCVGVSSAPRLLPCSCALRSPRPPPLKLLTKQGAMPLVL